MIDLKKLNPSIRHRFYILNLGRPTLAQVIDEAHRICAWGGSETQFSKWANDESDRYVDIDDM